jgi:threonine aldolase
MRSTEVVFRPAGEADLDASNDMPLIHRRDFLTAAAGGALTPAPSALAGQAATGPADTPIHDGTVQFVSDGLALTPAEYARVLARLTDETAVELDQYSRGGTVGRLEERFAALLGKEAALFLPTGTLANHLAVRLLTSPGRRRVLVQAESHLYCDTGDGAQELSGLNLVALAPGRASFTLAEVQTELARAETGRVANGIGAISIESPVRRRAGELFDIVELERIAAFARERGIGLHLDGARLLIASAHTGIEPKVYSSHFDTVFVSLWKYLNATSGAILAGPRQLLADLHHQRRMFGGALPYAWPQALVAAHYLEGFGDRFAQAVGAADKLFLALDQHPRCRIERPHAGTNVARLIVTRSDAQLLPQQLKERGIVIAEAGHSLPEGAVFDLVTNETILRRPVSDLVSAFASALA